MDRSSNVGWFVFFLFLLAASLFSTFDLGKKPRKFPDLEVIS